MTSTPGPWAFDGIRVFSPAHDEKYMVRNADGTESEHGRGLIALVYAPTGSGSTVANATLVAAAPDLLAALKAIVGFANDSLDGAGSRYTFDHNSPIGRDARAAIAKAEGV